MGSISGNSETPTANAHWMIYGASGYTGGLIAREAAKRGLRPVMAGRSQKKLAALAEELQLPLRVFHLEDAEAVDGGLEGIRLVLNCAGPFSATAKPLIDACLTKRVHYLDLTAEIDVFEYVHRQDGRARDAAIVLCSGVGFDVVPTDCIAAKLKSVLPDATHLALGFDTSATMSPGTAKTMVEGYPQGGKVRRDGQIVALRTDKWRRIDFGNGEKLATTIPWGDVSTAWHSTGIPNIEVYAAIPEAMRRTMWLARTLRSALRPAIVQRMLKKLIEMSTTGPDEQARENTPSFVWGEVRNARGKTRTARLVTPNGYSLTVSSALLTAEELLSMDVPGGSYTPSRLFGAEMVTRLPGTSDIAVE
jgi:short subunit dehydrogenase-like uncharacterized protein